MEYKLTFEDGSSAHLSHSGKKGMKWGVWNPETAARYAAEGKLAGGGGGGLDLEEKPMPGMSSPGMGLVYDTKKINESREAAAQYFKDHPLDQQWNEFKDQHVEPAKTGIKEYRDNVSSTASKYGTSAIETGGHARGFMESISKGDFGKAGEEFNRTMSSLDDTVETGMDYLSTLLGGNRVENKKRSRN